MQLFRHSAMYLDGYNATMQLFQANTSFEEENTQKIPDQLLSTMMKSAKGGGPKPFSYGIDLSELKKWVIISGLGCMAEQLSLITNIALKMQGKLKHLKKKPAREPIKPRDVTVLSRWNLTSLPGCCRGDSNHKP